MGQTSYKPRKLSRRKEVYELETRNCSTTLRNILCRSNTVWLLWQGDGFDLGCNGPSNVILTREEVHEEDLRNTNRERVVLDCSLKTKRGGNKREKWRS